MLSFWTKIAICLARNSLAGTAHRSSHSVHLEESFERSHRGGVANQPRNYLGTPLPKSHYSDLKHFDKKYFPAPFCTTCIMPSGCSIGSW